MEIFIIFERGLRTVIYNAAFVLFSHKQFNFIIDRLQDRCLTVFSSDARSDILHHRFPSTISNSFIIELSISFITFFNPSGYSTRLACSNHLRAAQHLHTSVYFFNHVHTCCCTHLACTCTSSTITPAVHTRFFYNYCTHLLLQPLAHLAPCTSSTTTTLGAPATFFFAPAIVHT